MSHLVLFAQLLIGHALCDYPLQADFMAKGKNHIRPIPGVPSWMLLVQHAAIHAGMVWFLTGSGVIALAELWLHVAIDYTKCDGTISFEQDQWLHVACKAVWAIVA